MVSSILKFLTVAGESVNKVLQRRWGNETSAEAGTSNAIDTLEREWADAVDKGDVPRLNTIRAQLIRLLNKTAAQRIGE